MATQVVESPDPTTAPLDPEPDEEQKPQEPTPQELKAQLREEKLAREAAETLNKELKARDEVWERRLAKTTPKASPRAETPEPDPLDELDLLTLLTEEKDPARIKQIFAKTVKAQIAAELKRGNFISREEAEKYTAQIIEGATATNRLVQEFPQLADPKSEFFQETQKQIGIMSDDPAYKGVPETTLFRMAALQAEVGLSRAGKLSKAESEEDRIARILAQKGLGGGRGVATEDDGGLTAEERRTIAGYKAAGFDIDEKSYREERKRANVGPRLAAMQGR